LSCSGPGGTGSDSVTVEGYENATGFVVDGYITGAEVFIDQDGNFISDSTDESTQSDSSGNFVIKKTAGDYVSIGGTDFDTQNSLDNLLLWHKTYEEFDPKAITPVTSVASFLTDPAAINDMLGLASDINVFTFDPVANKGDAGPNDFLYEKGNQLTTIAITLQNAINEVNNSLDTSQNIFLSVSNVLSDTFDETNEIVNIESFEFLGAVMTDLENTQTINIAEEQRENIVTALSSILPMIQVKTNDTVTNGIFNFATSTLQTDIRLIANGSASEELIGKYKDDILDYVAEDQNLDPADIVPEIIANDDTYFTDEDIDLTFNILSNDSYQINSQIDINLGVPTNGTIENSNGLITYSPDENYFGQDEFSYTIAQAGFSDSAEVSITIDSVNDEPEILSSTYQIDENTKEVGSIRATDVESQDLTYDIREGDSAALDLVGNNLTFKEDTDYEDKNEYEFVASVSDGTAESQKNLKIFINDINETPIITSNSEFAVDENTKAVGQVVATDPEEDDLTYTLFKADAAVMAINDDGFVTLNENANFETKESYSIQVKVTDGEFTDTQDILISVTDLNDAPIFTSNNQLTTNENSVVVGSVLATDEDQDSLVYTWQGSDAAAFDITELANGAGLSISFKNAPNYEADQQSYNFTVSVADNDTVVDQAITINVLDINDAPTAIDAFPTVIEIPENGGIPFTIQSTSCTDPRYFICGGTIHLGNSTTQYQFEDEDGDTIVFGLSGVDANSFSSTQNGSYLIKEFANYEIKSQYLINLVLSDGTLTTEVPLVVAITDENEAPEITSVGFTVDENETQVGVVEYTDPDNDSVNFKIESSVDYPDNSYFEIDQFSGNLTFKNPPDYEVKNRFEIAVVVQDSGGLNNYGYLTILLNDLNDTPPEITNPGPFTIAENQTAVATLQATDVEGGTIFFTSKSEEFVVDSVGNLAFASAPDYETQTQYTAVINVSDGTNNQDFNIIVNVTNVNDNAPLFTGDSARLVWGIQENETNLTSLLTANDADGDAYTFSVSGNDLEVVNETQLRFKIAPDFETKSSYQANLSVTDGIFTTSNAITVNVIDRNEPAVFTSPSSFTLNENETTVGTVTLKDPEGDPITIQGISGGTDRNFFNISTSTGILSFKNPGDYEQQSSYQLIVAASDSGTFDQVFQEITVNLNDVNEAPAFTSASTFSADENQTTVNSVTASDPENDTLTYSTTSSEFAIDASSGALSFIAAPDYETTNAYSLTVKVTDGEFEVEQAINVAVNNLNDNPPVFTGTTTFNRDERVIAIGNVSTPDDYEIVLLVLTDVAEDADGDTITFSAVTSDGDAIGVYEEDLGGTDIRLNPNASVIDYETSPVITESILMSDGKYEVEVPITLTLNNLNDNRPEITYSCAPNKRSSSDVDGSGDCYVQENDEDLVVVQYSLSDADGDLNTLSVIARAPGNPSIQDGESYMGLVHNAQNKTFSFPRAQDYETEDYLGINGFGIGVNDENITDYGDDSNKNIYILNENEFVHTINFATSIDAPEGRDDGFGALYVNDQDRNAAIRICLKGSDADSFWLQSSTGYDETRDCGGNQDSIMWKNSLSKPDYESDKKQYNLTIEVRDSEGGIGDDHLRNYDYTINITDVDDTAPTITSSSTFSIEENVVDDFVGTITATDVDSDDSSIIYSVDAPANIFQINSSTGRLVLYGGMADYETQDTYSTTVGACDTESNCSEMDIVVSIIDVNDAPVFTSGATFAVDENKTTIGTVTATDQDSGASLTYSTTSSEINIDAASGVMTFVSAPDFETKTSYSLTVVVTDGELSAEQAITVSINNLNDTAPEFTSAATFSAMENQTDIGTVTATDAEGDSVSFGVSGTELSITSSGVLTFNSAPDYETQNTYLATITATDGTNVATQDITVNVLNNDETDAPVLSNLTFSDSSVDVTDSSFELVVSLSFTDESGLAESSLLAPRILKIDGGGLAGSYFTATEAWTISSGTNKNGVLNATFVVPELQSTGTYYVWARNIRDLEGNSIDKSFTDNADLLVITGSEADKPTITLNAISPTSVDVTQATADVTITLALADSSGINLNTLPKGRLIKVDGGGAVDSYFDSNSAWSLVSGDSKSGIYQAIFTVPKDQSSGSYQLASGQISDIYNNTDELITSGILTVAGSEGNVPQISNPTISSSTVNVIAAPKSVAVTVSFTDDSGINVNNLPIPRLIETSDAGLLVDANSTWSLTSGTIKAGVLSADFTIPQNQISGSYYLWSRFIFDIYENAGQLNSSPLLTVINNAAPVFTSSTSFSADENQTTIGTVTASDAESDDITFSISGSDITINASSGVIAFASAPDYETTSSYAATVTATDGINTVTQDITVSVNNLNDNAPTFTSSATFSVEEGTTAIGTATASDADGNDLTFSISGSDISINSSTGAMVFNSAPDYEKQTSYSATITVTDGNTSVQQGITVSIINVVEGPAPTNSTVFINELHYDMIGTDEDEYVEIAGPAGTDLSGWKLMLYNGNNDSLYDQQTLSGILENTSGGYGFKAFDFAQIQNGSPDAIALVNANDECVELISYEGVLSPNSGYCSDYISIDIGVDQNNSNESENSLQKIGTGLISSDFTWVSPRAKTKGARNSAQTFADPTTVTETLFGKEVLIGSVSVGFYDRDADYPTWDDADGDGISDRHEVLIAQHINDNSSRPLVYNSDNTAVVAGKWQDPYDGTYYYSPSDLTIDHVVSLYESHISGAGNWSSTSEKRTYANTGNKTSGTLPETSHQFLAVGSATNGSKGSSDPTDWMPPLADYHCTYLKKWVEVKFINGLYFDQAEFNFIKAEEADCDSSALPTLSANTDNAAPTASSASYYLNLLPQDQTSGTLTLGASDANDDALSYTITQDPTYGTISLSGATVTYQTAASTQSANTETFKFTVSDGIFTSNEATITIDLRTDPLYQYQWHLNNTGQKNFAQSGGREGFDLNIDSVIVDGYSGNGVVVAVLDEGLELAHEDLVDNIVSGSYDFLNSDTDPTNSNNDGDHGTSVAGIIAAKGWNNKGGRGVAPNASLIGYNYLKLSTSDNQLKSWGISPPVAVSTDIYNMSYGYGYATNATTFDLPKYISSTLESALISGVTNQRNGKGAIYIKSSGNYFQSNAVNAGGNEGCGVFAACTEMIIDNYHTLPYIITVGALNADDDKTTYSSSGSALWVSGFGGEYGANNSYVSGGANTAYTPAIMTVDQTGCTNGYVGVNSDKGVPYNAFENFSGGNSENANCSYTSTFNGTSSAAPTIAGVVALMLEANPDLTWRDVKHILATTSEQIMSGNNFLDPDSLIPIVQWVTNKAGYKHHNWYGFGKINAAEAINLAQSTTADNLGTFVSSDFQGSGTINSEILFKNQGINTTTIPVSKPAGADGIVEFVRVTIQFDHDVPRSVGFRLLSPDGTVAYVMTPYQNIGSNPSQVLFDIGVSTFYGESFEGNWTLAPNDYINDNEVGTLIQWGIEVYGH
tara:strand:+ start:578 stop:10978 length:10401 start_codon:yes stop_codon:yes gene_type:complete